MIKSTLDNKAHNAVEFTLRVGYDNDLSQIYFDDFKAEVDSGNGLMFYGRNGVDYLVLGDVCKPFFKKSQLNKMKKDELISLCYDLGIYINDDYTKNDLIDELSQITIEDYYKNHYDNTPWHDLECSFTIRGYCQGDALKVLLLDDANPLYYTESFLQNLFYDTPFYATATFLGQEIYLGEYSNSVYEYDKDEIINNFSNQYNGVYKQRLITFLENSLPDYIE